MHLLGILIDRLRAMREPHPIDVSVSLPQMIYQHAQMVMLTPVQLKASSYAFSNGALPGRLIVS
jgi:hypothetical protein